MGKLIARAQFPLKLTDGMAMAKPVLSTQVGDIPKILDAAGNLVDPNAPDQIAEQIQWIFEHWTDACARAAKARAKCVEQYSTDAMATILAEVIARL